MITLLSDLDNTLIYSHRYTIPGEKIAVEYLNGREQSYMTRKTFEYLRSAIWLHILPITTRTEEQYKRLQFPMELGINMAIVCNGGKLLINNIEDKEWTDKSCRVSARMKDELEKAAGILRADLDGSILHHPEPYMYYAKCKSPGLISEEIRRLVDEQNVTAFYDTHKVYLFAACISKGDAVQRLVERFDIQRTVAVGDGVADITMLDAADYAFASGNIYDKTSCVNRMRMNGLFISDQICNAIEQLHTEGILM